MNIEPETMLIGQWVLKDGRLVADDVNMLIVALTKSHLVEIGRDASGWLTLYRDPNDGRLWELDYPQSERHRGGPPRLRVISPEVPSLRTIWVLVECSNGAMTSTNINESWADQVFSSK